MSESICEKCLHRNVCGFYEPDEECGACNHFADKSRFVELPCKVGDTVWVLNPIDEICEALVEKVELNLYTNPQTWICFRYYSKLVGAHTYKSRIDMALNETVFLTREEAEAALAERMKENV